MEPSTICASAIEQRSINIDCYIMLSGVNLYVPMELKQTFLFARPFNFNWLNSLFFYLIAEIKFQFTEVIVIE